MSGDLLHLTFAIDNQTMEAVNPAAWGIVRGVTASDYGPTGVLLLDLANLKRHRPGNYTLGRDLTVGPGSRREYWAQYAAPPLEVKEMTIQIPDGQPMYDVPISG